MPKLSVLGSGGWGIALAIHAAEKGYETVLWSVFEDEVAQLLKKRESEKLLSGVKIPESIEITNCLSKVNGSQITIIAVPSFAVRETVAKLKGIDCGIVVNVAKGFEKGSNLRLSEVIESELSIPAVVLSGPSHAEEVARKVPTTLVCASKDIELAERVQKALINNNLRIYTNRDVVGVEIGGALKNVIAVAAGIQNGLEVGDNTRAALITRGLAEIARLGVAMGAKASTFSGLSGIGDLIVTCMSEHSRNNRFGNFVGKGESVAKALEIVGTVEGYHAVGIACDLAKKYGVYMPITEECYNILYKGRSPLEAMSNLMSRPGGPEEEETWL